MCSLLGAGLYVLYICSNEKVPSLLTISLEKVSQSTEYLLSNRSMVLELERFNAGHCQNNCLSIMKKATIITVNEMR